MTECAGFEKSGEPEDEDESAQLTLAAYEELQREKREEELTRKRTPVRKAEVIQFPLWPELERAAPNAFLRSALFGVVKKGNRRYCEQERLATWPDTELAYTGQQLDQYDEDVWMQLAHLHNQQGVLPGQAVYVNARARGFMRDFGRHQGGSNAAKAFYSSVIRMEACGIHLTQRIDGREVEYIGSLIHKAARIKGEECWAIVLNPDLLPYFAPGHYSRIDWLARLQLKTDLARWMQGYVVSQQATLKHPHRIAVGRLYELSGSSAELKRFRFNARKAMEELVRTNQVAVWRITEGDALEFAR